MTLAEILATPRKIAYVNNTGMDLRMWHDQIMAAVEADSTTPPDDLVDLVTIRYVHLGTERRAILEAA
jgi:hypothetical protein